jgi:HNH endonuclease
MRPIDKGPCPQINGIDKTVSDYKAWREDLIERIGYYCAYCNMPLSHNLNVEHVVPKNPQPNMPPGSMLDWQNMLIACGPCNNAKSNNPCDPQLHYLPESHNGLLPFEHIALAPFYYLLIAPKQVSASFSQNAFEKASRTIHLFQWDNANQSGRDLRSVKRRDAYKTAISTFEMYRESKKSDEQRASLNVATIAKSTGFFAVWFEVFATEPSVLKCLVDPLIFPGIVPHCFDPVTYAPIGRNPQDPFDRI